jgi:hypothetical protein
MTAIVPDRPPLQAVEHASLMEEEESSVEDVWMLLDCRFPHAICDASPGFLMLTGYNRSQGEHHHRPRAQPTVWLPSRRSPLTCAYK